MMKKLLLLSVFVQTLTTSFAAGNKGEDSLRKSDKDSTLPSQMIGNPRDGFKNLFETIPASGYHDATLNPQAISFVDDYMDKYSDKLTKMKDWGKPYFDMMDDILAEHGVPTELKYLSVIESELKSFAVSWAGAVGPWQFMPQTARELGLIVSRYKDERTDFTKSTHAAARYLTYLYGLYNDWLLVIAAYNGGPGNVDAAIRKSGSRDFWNLQYYLPTESRNHVKKFIATHYIMEGGGSIATLTKSEVDHFIPKETLVSPTVVSNNIATVSISGKYNSAVIAQNIDMPLAEFNRMNPSFDKQMSVSNTYDLRLPADKSLLFQARKPQILEQSITLALTLAGK